MLVVFCIYVVLNLVDQKECALEHKIVGGQYANITDFPHSAHLAVKCDKVDHGHIEGAFSWICGSSIINQEILLTAAHCLAECKPNSRILVSVGHVHIFKGSMRTVYSFLVHKEFDLRKEANDIGLVRLRKPLKFGSTVGRVVLMEDPPYNEKAQVAGWGMIDEELEIMGPYLKSIDQYVWEKWQCINRMREFLRGTFCASSDRRGHYASSGDSGSALVVRGYIQIGLVSFKKPGISKSVIVYTDTGYFYQWIYDNTKLLLCNRSM